jgi:hypothetical protein
MLLGVKEIMKRLIGLISILSFLLTGCEDEESTPPNSTLESHDTSEEITIFYFDNPPHIYIDENGRLTGAVYDFIEEGIAPEMGVKFNWNRESTAIPRQIELIILRNLPHLRF